MAAEVLMPTLYIPHGGGPCFFMDPPPAAPLLWDRMAAYLRALTDGLPATPKAILVVSAHWETSRPAVHAGVRPGLLFDYYGFPEHTFRLTYAAPGAPDLAVRTAELLAGAGFTTDLETERGWDHGVFIPLLLAAPEATIPVFEISILESLDPAAHLALGRALAPLRAEGVLIIGSGLSYHNLRTFFGPAGDADSERFDAWLTGAVADPDRRDAALTAWSAAPGARACHPREEHLLPLMVAAGAAAGEAGVRDYSDHIMGKAVSGYRFG